MKAPRRLLEEGGLGAELLRSAERGQPPARARQRAGAAVGLAFLAAKTASAGTAATVGVSMTVKVLAGIGLAVAVAGGVALVAPTSSRAPAAAAASVASTTRAPAEARARGVSWPSSLPALSYDAIPPVAPVVSPATPAPPSVASVAAAPPSPPIAPPSTPSVSSPGLMDEIRVLEGAKRALGAGQPAAALDALGTYDKRFPFGHLVPEAEVLRIEALARSGERAAAAAHARAFVAAHPDSPLVDRARAYAQP